MTHDNACAVALEKYARAQEHVAREIAEGNAAMKSTASSMDAAARREDSRIAVNKAMIEQMRTWRCTPSGHPMSEMPRPELLGD